MIEFEKGERVTIFSKWVGEIVQPGPEQSVVRIVAGSEAMNDRVHCFQNKDLRKENKKGKPAGNVKRRGYSDHASGDLKRGKRKMSEDNGTTAPEQSEQEHDFTQQYNDLVEEAKKIGLPNVKPVATRFRNAETGAARCKALAEAIEAHKHREPDPPKEEEEVKPEEVAPPKKSKKKAEDAPPSKQKESKPMRTNAKKKVAAKSNGAAKKATAKRAVIAKERSGVVAQFGTREGTNREKLLLCLYKNKNKPVKVSEVSKAVYGGKGDHEDRLKLKMVIVGLNVMIKEGRLPYLPVEQEGRGDDATIMLATKSGR